MNNENETSADTAQKPKSKWGCVWVSALVVGVIGLVFCWYIAGLARGFSNS